MSETPTLADEIAALRHTIEDRQVAIDRTRLPPVDFVAREMDALRSTLARLEAIQAQQEKQE